MREVLRARIWTASLTEANDLVSPEAMGAYIRHGIQCVLTVAHDVRPKCVAVLPQLCLPVRESERTPLAFFNMAFRFHHAFGPVLIHCNAGMNRSRVFAAAIMHSVYGETIEDAIRSADPPDTGLVVASWLELARRNAR